MGLARCGRLKGILNQCSRNGAKPQRLIFDRTFFASLRDLFDFWRQPHEKFIGLESTHQMFLLNTGKNDD